MNARNSSRGFTAIELAIAVAILGIVMALGVPGFQSVLQDRQQSSQLLKLRQTLVFARSEAIKRAQHVSVCARATDASCGTDWSDGWLVYSDPDSGTPDTLDTDDILLKLTDLSGSGLSISANAVVRPAPMQSQNNIRFSPRGRASWSLGTLVLCDQRGEEHALGLVINGAGTLRHAYAQPGSGEVIADALGNEAKCA